MAKPYFRESLYHTTVKYPKILYFQLFEAGVQNRKHKTQKLNLRTGRIEIAHMEPIYRFLDLRSMRMTDL